MKVIIGLGNPGFKYRATRHNIGFMVVDRLAASMRVKLKKKLFSALCGQGRFKGEEVLLVKPLTYVNLSGKAVSEIQASFEVATEDMLIIADDADLELGRIRVRGKGSSGGHNGMRSIIEELGTEEFPRLKVGIDSGSRARDILLSDYVLKPFNRAQRKALEGTLEACGECARTWIVNGTAVAMNRFNPSP